VTDPIYIGVDGPVEGANLVRALGYHGLSSGLVRSDARWQIEVTSPVFALEPLSTMLTLASATLLMVLAGVTKNHLIWEPRRV
jgi:hypothetical protein